MDVDTLLKDATLEQLVDFLTTKVEAMVFCCMVDDGLGRKGRKTSIRGHRHELVGLAELLKIEVLRSAE